MRLTHIKLAGFKSFVDPTHIALPGQLIGVVGPNGCGKSNVIDAVRWVLGESSARHLRGETMQDVIFNGSGERKPANRASVELVFDNSLGKVTGPFSQYGEISIKRVLERQGDSSYYINNIPVRRRDVADIFLGTGLGARAYAIIEQGMISRIVDAKPEELRVFLEEAAGVSKYRERRKETENRLDDARENLLRVEDIRRELGVQIERLQEQAIAAEQYRTFEADIRRNQCLLWAVRGRDAGNLRARLAGEMERATLDLERTTAALREVEARLETSRAAHYAAGDAVHAAQGGLYEANAEFSRVEQQLQFLRTNRQRAQARTAELEEQIGRDEQRIAALVADLAGIAEERERAAAGLEAHEGAALDARDAMPSAEQRHREARAELERMRQQLAQAQREREVAAARRDQTDRVLIQLRTRRERLRTEFDGIAAPDEEAIAELRAGREEVESQIAQVQDRQGGIQARIPEVEAAVRAAAQGVEAMRHKLASLEARRHALVALQQQVGASEQMAAWLGQHGLGEAARLWEKVQVTHGWEDAVEAVLRERLNALRLDDLSRLSDWFGASPPGKLAVYRGGSATSDFGVSSPAGCVPLATYVTCSDPEVQGAVAEWLDGVFAAPGAAEALAAAAGLPNGQCVVSREGHVFTAHSVGFHAPDSEIHGLLERKQEIAGLEAEIPGVAAGLAAERERQAEGEAELVELRAARDRVRDELTALSQRRHEVDLGLERLTQAADRARHRRTQIDEELAEIDGDERREREALEESAMAIAEADDRANGLSAAVGRADGEFEKAEEALARARERTTEAERLLQASRFAMQTLESKAAEIDRATASLSEQKMRAEAARGEAQGELSIFDEAPLEAQVGEALDIKQAREVALAQARDTLSEAERALRAADEERARLERALDPLRESIGELRLKEQEARIAEEGFAEQLAQATYDAEALALAMEKPPRPNALQQEINRLQEALSALGAVNLAALDELGKTTERKAFLDAQSADLNEAVNTLEDAIRRIDRETRERLSDTFETVNKNLAEMFPQLFGGGEAKLVMTGDEILDSGVQIIARPPGKKNASIQLLSGGEKALTAVSLVFSLFKLNPAPFCLLDEVDAPLDDSNTGRFCQLVRKMADQTQFIFISHNKITMEIAEQLVGVTQTELGVSRVVAVDIEEALKMREEQAA